MCQTEVVSEIAASGENVGALKFLCEKPPEPVKASDLPTHKKLVHLIRDDQGEPNVES